MKIVEKLYIMRIREQLVLSVLFWMLTFSLKGQESTATPKYAWDSPFVLSSIRGGVLVSDFFDQIFIDSERSRLTFEGDIGFNNTYFLVGQFGLSSSNRVGVLDTLTISHDGYFGSIGAEFNLIRASTPDHGLLLGLHYGFAQFDQALSYKKTDSYWGDYSVREGRDKQTGVTAGWIDFTFGAKVKIVKYVYLGLTMHNRVRLDQMTSGVEHFGIGEIPGYGYMKLNEEDSPIKTSITYSLLIGLPFNSDKVSVIPK